MLIVASDAHRSHLGLEIHNGETVPSFERPERADLIADSLRADGHEFTAPGPLDLGLVERVHDPLYVELLRTAWDRWVERGETGPAAMGFSWAPRGSAPRRPDDLIGQLGHHSFAADTSIVASTWDAVSSSAAIAVTAADVLSDAGDAGDGDAARSVVYALCRPPGHHATADQFGGYCYLNNAALAARRLLDRGRRRVAVLDVDYHHGNGTQSVFERRSDVLTVSLHADPREEFPWFTGHADESGLDDGEGWNLNLPLPRGTGRAEWFRALDRAVERVSGSGADALVVALGVDTYADDPLGTFDLRTADFTTAGATIAELGLPTVVVQEGGYAVEEIGHNVAAFLTGSH